MLPKSTTRVRRFTAPRIKREIRDRTLSNIARLAGETPGNISRHIGELDREWDMERTLEANAAVIGLIGLGLGAFVDRKWLILPAAVSGFLLQHALQGWCPPVPVFRRLGYRTAHEIDREKYALKELRGDFRRWTDGDRRDTRRLLEAAEI